MLLGVGEVLCSNLQKLHRMAPAESAAQSKVGADESKRRIDARARARIQMTPDTTCPQHKPLWES